MKLNLTKLLWIYLHRTTRFLKRMIFRFLVRLKLINPCLSMLRESLERRVCSRFPIFNQPKWDFFYWGEIQMLLTDRQWLQRKHYYRYSQSLFEYKLKMYLTAFPRYLLNLSSIFSTLGIVTFVQSWNWNPSPQSAVGERFLSQRLVKLHFVKEPFV